MEAVSEGARALPSALAGPAIVLVLLWSLPWKGIALWKAARNAQKVWFVILFVVNTLALLEILYIFVFSRRHREPGPAF